ncbi:D-galactarolactone cycloisomerase [Neorhizobium galegae]|uniref:mandelate racemase/muconate lactonizing enzyme family protein n=1 Tax=Neorhizobium galegae TaxID=399 RepID=UPI001AE594FD|nr:mandelate racemase/muconate lactonizing enzyme family protein [Neorhizobium galegae]MBP2550490.1 D-galactarolactone cycloisomerase [Neorhizobium galegae]
MKIVAVRTHLLEHRLDVAFESASMRFDRRAHVLVEIECADGTTGWGECLGPARPNAAVVAAYANWLIGENPLETEKICARLYNALRDQGQRGLTVTALSGIDMALWDIKGKHFGAPISILLGGRFRESVKAYATGSFKRDGVDRVEDNARDVARYWSEGFHATKIKIGFGVEEDLRVVRAAREAVGSDMRIMVDANHGYDAVEAIRFGQAAAELNLDWFEEPVVPEQLAAYREVRARQPIPVAGGETWHTRWGMKEPVETRCVDILQPDLAGVGGFTEAKRVADLAALHGVRVVPHVWGTAVHIAAALQFMAAMVPSPVRVNPIEPILEFDRTDNPFRQAIVKTPIEHVNGVVTIPDGPGLGIEINRAALAEFKMGDA